MAKQVKITDFSRPPESEMRNFTTHEGRRVELIGATTKVQIWIDGKLYRTMSGLQAARRTAIDYSRRHGTVTANYLESKPTYTHTTGSTLETWPIMFVLDRQHAMARDGLAGLSQLGCLDAVEMMPAGGMTSTGMGSPFPLLVRRAL